MKIAILGAGSIGVYVGGCLRAAGGDVVLIGRERMRQRLATHGLKVSDYRGWSASVEGSDVCYAATPDALAKSDLVLVCVKSADTAQAADQVRRCAPGHALVASFQNGIGNVDVLRAALPDRPVVGGMVPFNVVQLPDGRLHRGTPGEIMVQAHAAWKPWLELFCAATIPLGLRNDFVQVQWGKLVLNLNNAVNALSGQPLRAQLMTRAYRTVVAQLIDEALTALQAAGVEPVQIGAFAPDKLPNLLRLPDDEFVRVAAALVAIAPEARSSMWEDFEAGRLTEVDELNGAVVRLAAQHGLAAPANEAICALVHAAEKGGNRHIGGEALMDAVLTCKA